MRVKFITLFLACLILASCFINPEKVFASGFDKPGKFRPNLPISFDFNVANNFVFSERFNIDDIDYYKLSFPRKAYLDVKTSGQVNSTVELLDANNQLLSFDLDNGENENGRVVYEIPSAGEYLLRLSNPTKVAGFYDLELNLIESNTLTDDFDNKLDASFVINLNSSKPSQSFVGKINYEGDTDFFKLNLQNTGDITITLKASNSEDFKLSLYDENFNLIDTRNSKSNISFDKKLAAFNYTIVVQGEALRDLDYELELSHNSLIADSDRESLENFNGQTIVMGAGSGKFSKEKFTSEINYVGDLDIFKIEIPQEGVLILTTGRSRKRIKNGLRLSASLYNEDFDLIERDLIGFNFRFRNRLSPGNYYLTISSPSRSILGKYKIKSFFSKVDKNNGFNI